MRGFNVFAALVPIVLSACVSHPPVIDGPSVWCNKSYIKEGVFQDNALNIARQGYVYSLASSLALENDPAWFKEADRLVKVDRKNHDSTDFRALTFELRNIESPEVIDEVIIAYSGTDSWYDWIFVNLPFGGAPSHYEQGRMYAKEVAEKYKTHKPIPPPIVVTGASLGGGIAINVTKHPDTSELVSKTWVFNSSPKTLVNGDPDERIWAASMKGEILHPLRGFFKIAPGLEGLGLANGHSSEGYYLVQSNGAFLHYNYVLTRNLLHAADYAIKTPPDAGEKMKAELITILEQSSDRNCLSPSYQMPAPQRW